MRTNIVLDDDLLREAMKYSRARSKRALVDEALRAFVVVRSAEERTATYRATLGRLGPRLRSVRLRQPPSELVRADRDRA